jgi:predicted metal-dependent phosphoesterase TrpH
VIDLHLHTTASDGLLAPADLVRCAAAAGLTILSITDHDTLAGVPAAREAADRLGVRLVPGLEITAVERDRDVHILGYFVDADSRVLTMFLGRQREDRVRRVREIASQLDAHGMHIDVDALIGRAARAGATVGRPALADALIAAGHVATRDEAFARWLGRGCPAFVPRCGASAADVIAVVHDSGGIASLAHPGVLDIDDSISALVEAGLDAIEVWHTDHSPEDRERYRAIAARFGVARSGGSDYHGDGLHRAPQLGLVSLPAEEFARLESAAKARSR